MKRFKEIYKNDKILLKYDNEDKQYLLHILDRNLRRRLKANLLFSFNGKTFIKASGGKSININKLKKILEYLPI